MKNLGSVYVEGIEPKIRYKGGLTRNLDLDYDEDENAPREKTYVYFFGIPYAKPPIKRRRFEPPQRYKSGILEKRWHYDATRAKPDYCVQPGTENKRLFIGSEDCLYLNIYLPKKPKYIFMPLPVLVYFHGGGFFSGTGNYKYTTPDSIIKENIIFVTVNYRLGPFGFLNMHAEHCKGNAGLKDQALALRWIKENIEAFRGNPDNVTICGGGTGGTCVNFHLISPLSKGLFHKAIVQSGGIYSPWGFRGHQRATMRHFKEYRDHEYASRDKVVRGLKSLGTVTLAKLDRKIREDTFDEPLKMEIHLGPSFEKFPEGAFIPTPASGKIEDLMEQTEPNIPILAGLTTKEGYCMNCNHVGDFDVDWVKDDDEFIHFLSVNRWKKKAATEKRNLIRTAYFPNIKEWSETYLRERLADLCTDLWFYRFYDNFKFGVRERKPELDLVDRAIQRHEDKDDSVDKNNPAAPLYVYKFDFVSEINPTLAFRKRMTGAGHADEIAYLFPTREVRKTFHPFPSEVRKTIKTMCSLWASFCKTGKPTCPLYPNLEWIPHTERKPRYLEIGKEINLERKFLFEHRWNFLKGHFKPEDQEPTPATTPTTPACSAATQDEWFLALSEDTNRETYEYCCDVTEIPKYRNRSIQSKSSSGTSGGDRSQSTQLTSLDERGPGTSTGYKKPSIQSKSSASTQGDTSESHLISSPVEPLPSTSSGISGTFRKFFSPKKKKITSKI